MFGGLYHSEVSILNLNSLTWKNVPNIEFKRYRHSAHLLDTKIYLFAGETNKYSDYYNDLFSFNLNTMKLNEIRCKG